MCGCVSESHPVTGTGCTFGVPLSPDVMEQIFPLIEFLSQPESEYSAKTLRFTHTIPCQFTQHETNDTVFSRFKIWFHLFCACSSVAGQVLLYAMFTSEDVENTD